jgi:2-C-methyl-D-erythritol 2,4-cyclodiphosphate synthase
VNFRIGHGFDVHRLEAGDGVVLGGVRIPCEYRVIAHSDGDVLIHALCDALLGAAALGDLGRLFPDTDAKYRGADAVSVKATTSEGLGFTGRNEGIAAHAVALIAH